MKSNNTVSKKPAPSSVWVTVDGVRQVCPEERTFSEGKV